MRSQNTNSSEYPHRPRRWERVNIPSGKRGPAQGYRNNIYICYLIRYFHNVKIIKFFVNFEVSYVLTSLYLKRKCKKSPGMIVVSLGF